MRAEILALYCSINFYDEIVSTGFLEPWSNKIPMEDMVYLFIQDIAGSGFATFPACHSNLAFAPLKSGLLRAFSSHLERNL